MRRCIIKYCDDLGGLLDQQHLVVPAAICREELVDEMEREKYHKIGSSSKSETIQRTGAEDDQDMLTIGVAVSKLDLTISCLFLD